MLTEEQIKQNTVEFVRLLTIFNDESETKLDINKLFGYLTSQRADFFNKPYNAYPEFSYKGSLCEQSLQLYKELSRLCHIYAKDKYSNSEIILAALFKNLYRCELFEIYLKNQKNEATGNWEQVEAVRTREQRPIFGTIGFSSYMILKKFIPDIKDELVEAICYSGISDAAQIDSYNIRTSYPLVTLTTMAEFASLYFNIDKDITKEKESEQDND